MRMFVDPQAVDPRACGADPGPVAFDRRALSVHKPQAGSREDPLLGPDRLCVVGKAPGGGALRVAAQAS